MKGRVRHIHFTGIGGIGMSGIAEVLHWQGFSVQGSDAAESANVRRLRKLGIDVFIGHRPEHVGKAQVVVYSSAVAASNPELQEAMMRGIPVIPRAEMLAELMRMKQGIAVAGSHGKTTITSMIAHVMGVAGLDPTYVIGGRLRASGNNAHLGESDYLLAEADESDGSFLRLTPIIAVVSNIDPEHLDYYGDFDHLLAAFRQFVNLAPFYGRVVLNHEHPHVAALREGLHRPVTTYGCSPQADIHIADAVAEGGGQRITLGKAGGEKIGEFFLPMPGLHNAENALAAIAVSRELGLSFAAIGEAFASFSGIERRFQAVEMGEGFIVDDYAHHPQEIKMTLAAARSIWPERSIEAIFQPHRYTRSRDLMEEFMGAFDDADRVDVLPIYAASEEPIEGVSAETMVASMRARGHRSVQACPSLAAAKDLAIEAVGNGAVVLLMGAGSIGGLAAELRQCVDSAAALAGASA
ncbi:MAG: UDP-N-acetylmuramate--L-alanine ligase [Mariprofundaceae bacterium]